jgi:hypothetical protein
MLKRILAINAMMVIIGMLEVQTSLAVNYPLIPDKNLTVTIAASGYTRLSMEDERITDVFVYPQEALRVQIHDQGYLIIVPDQQLSGGRGKSLKEQIHLTVTGENGTTQDLSLCFAGKNPEPVKFMKLNWVKHQTIEGE